MSEKTPLPFFYPKKRQEWRQWLLQNHEDKKAVRLVLYKKETGKPTLNYDEAVEEALCFGWIDANATKRDDESYFIQISERNPKSSWSKPNRERVAKLTKLA